jgi:hypothetical protein
MYKFEDIKWVMRSCKSMKDREYNDQEKQREENNELQKTKD